MVGAGIIGIDIQAAVAYIVVFKDSATKEDIDGYIACINASGGNIKYRYDPLMKAVAANMDDLLAQSFRRETDDIDYIASSETVTLNAAHPPQGRAIEAFNEVLPKIKLAVISSRHDWDNHEPRMWSRASGLSDPELSGFVIENDLVEVRAVIGKIRIPAINDSEGEGFIHDPRPTQQGMAFIGSFRLILTHLVPTQGTEDVLFHSLFTDEGNRDADGQPTTFRAIQTRDTPLEFFNE
ncbi:hypothetical protein FRC07_001195 [Ceratobasidium sp. 392]|nr:hypothetical protein FRC07_001195 [Ceratobasidium sp. 392]